MANQISDPKAKEKYLKQVVENAKILKDNEQIKYVFYMREINERLRTIANIASKSTPTNTGGASLGPMGACAPTGLF